MTLTQDSTGAQPGAIRLASEMIADKLAEESDLKSREFDALCRITLGALS